MITSKAISEMCHWDVGIYLVGWTSLCKFPDCWNRDVRYKFCKNDVEKHIMEIKELASDVFNAGL